MGQSQSLDFCCTTRKNNEATVKDIACAKAAAAEARDNAKADCLVPVTDGNTFSPIKEASPFESVHELLVGPRKATTTPLTGSPDSVGGDTFKGLPPGNYDDMSEEDKVEAFRACVPSRSLEELRTILGDHGGDICKAYAAIYPAGTPRSSLSPSRPNSSAAPAAAPATAPESAPFNSLRESPVAFNVFDASSSSAVAAPTPADKVEKKPKVEKKAKEEKKPKEEKKAKEEKKPKEEKKRKPNEEMPEEEKPKEDEKKKEEPIFLETTDI
jgi:hypothetical protein